METNLRTYVTFKDKYGISCVHPDVYMKRFVEYTNRITDTEKARAEGINIFDIKQNEDSKINVSCNKLIETMNIINENESNKI